MAVATKTNLRNEYSIRLNILFDEQQEIKDSRAKRKIIRAGRRFGKTVYASDVTVEAFLDSMHPVYATPTKDQLDAWWFEVTYALKEPIDAKVLIKNEVDHTITRPGSRNRIKGKTAWNADTLRGDFANPLILDEYQLMNEDAWGVVGAPMLLDNDGDAIFIYTPPSLHTKSVTKARDPLHAAKLYAKHKDDTDGRWQCFHYTSKSNPHLSEVALQEIVGDMSQAAYRQEILAEDDLESAWKGLIYKAFNRVLCVQPRFPIPDNWLIYSGHDFGGGNPAALFTAVEPATGNYYHFHEYLPGAGKSVKQHVDAFREITAGYRVVASIGGNQTSEDEIRHAYGAYGWNIQAPTDRYVLPQIDKVVRQHELNKIIVFEDMYNYLYEKDNFSWKLNNENEPTKEIDDEAKYHLMACERYEQNYFTPELVEGSGGDKPNQRSTY